MAKKREFSKGKKNIIAGLLEEYDIQSVEDIQEALKDLLGGTIQNMMEAELSEHLGYERTNETTEKTPATAQNQRPYEANTVKYLLSVPQDRNSEFEPKIVPKRKKDISSIEHKIISMYAKGLSTRQISDQIEEIYGFEVSEGMVSDITNKLLPEIDEWQNRPLCRVYPIVFIDAVHFSVRDNSIIKKLAAYIIMGISEEGKKEVLSIHIGENESSK